MSTEAKTRRRVSPAARQLRQEVGARIADLREERGWSQKELASRAGISPVRMSRIENGVYAPMLEDLPRLRIALGVAIDMLFPVTPGAAIGDPRLAAAVQVFEAVAGEKDREAAARLLAMAAGGIRAARLAAGRAGKLPERPGTGAR